MGRCGWGVIVYKASKFKFVSKLSSRKQYKNNIRYSLESFTDESSKLKNEETENESVHSYNKFISIHFPHRHLERERYSVLICA